MSTPLPAAIEVEDRWPESYVFRLPRRDLGALRWVGAALIVLGVVAALSVIAAIAAIFAGVDALFHRHVFGVLMFVGLPACGGLLPFCWGLAILRGRSEITIAQGKLRARERIGFLSWGKRWEVAEITSLTVTSIFNVEEPRSAPEWIRAFDALRVAGEKKSGTLAWGYGAELLEPLAVAVGERCDRAVLAQSPEFSGSRKPIGVHSDYRGTMRRRLSEEESTDDEEDELLDEDELHEDDGPEDVPPTKPQDSQVEVEYFDDGLTIKVPPAGLWKGSGGLFLFSLVWNGAMLLFTTLFVFATTRNPGDKDGLWVALLFLPLFWSVGIGVLLAAINMGRRQAAIAVAGDALMVIQSGPFGTKRKEWTFDELKVIVAGPSGMKVNDVDVVELQILAHDQPKFGMLAGRDSHEIAWLASVLCEAIDFSAPARDDRSSDEGTASANAAE